MNALKLLAVFAVAFISACGLGGSTAASRDTAYQSQRSANSQSDSLSSTKKDGGGGGGGREEAPANPAAQFSLANTSAAQTDVAPTERKIIRNADLSLEAASPEEVQQKITAIAESKGGFVIESQQSSSDVKVNVRDVVTMTLRVPAGKFAESLDEIRKTASRVIVETVKGEDVTEEFVDIEARLKAERALEQQFLEIMKRANSVEDALKVQAQLGSVRSEIERIEGRKKFLENQASLSTIKVKIQAPTAISASSAGFFYRLGESLNTGVDFALSFILGLVTLVIAVLPFALFIVLPIYMVVRYAVRKRTKPASATSIVKDEIE